MSVQCKTAVAFHIDDYKRLLSKLEQERFYGLVKNFILGATRKQPPKADQYIALIFDWHDEFRNPGYEFLKNFLKELDDKDHPYDFIRIGENIEDFEVSAELGILELRREVGINVDMENQWLE